MKFLLRPADRPAGRTPLCIWVYLRAGSPPVATSDPPFPFEEAIVHLPLHARIDRELVKAPPVEASPTNLEIGAHIYRKQCAACHGLYGLPPASPNACIPRRLSFGNRTAMASSASATIHPVRPIGR